MPPALGTGALLAELDLAYQITPVHPLLAVRPGLVGRGRAAARLRWILIQGGLQEVFHFMDIYPLFGLP